MSEHRASRHVRRRRVDSFRIRVLLCLGLLAAPAVTGTFAFWTDEVAIQGTTLTTGTLDINVKGGDPQATATLSMSAMVPGSSSAEVLPVNNVGTAPAKYTMTGGLSGVDAGLFNTADANGLLLTVRAGGSVSGSGQSATCTGGTVLIDGVALTNNTSTGLITTRRPSPALAATSGSEPLCFSIKLADTAPGSLQNKTTNAVFTVTGTSDVS